ncbi:MAG: helix-turn-helix transcriptional regulator [Gammaproteobacteria bacterium]|nr:helix-turn-helix transcriptional regulator [Gammaproteobacteria bacterium]
MGHLSKNLQSVATELLKCVGNPNPTQKHIELMNSLLSHVVMSTPIMFDERLSQREVNCLFLAAKGKTSEETAVLLNISPATVESHRKHIKRKLNCLSLSQAVFEGIRWGYLQPLSLETR